MKTARRQTTEANSSARMIRRLVNTLLPCALLAAFSVGAQQFSFVELAATIVSDGSNHDETTDTRVKYNTGTTARKSYYQFDIPTNANTNNGLDLTFTSSRKQYMTVWGLIQDYPGLNTDILWSTAQANQTDSALNNDLLTDPTNTFTATPLYEIVSPAGNSASTWTVHIPGPWGPHLFGTKLILVLTGRDGPDNDSGGFRAVANTAYLQYYDIFAGSPPSLGAIADLATFTGQPSPTNTFTVGDPEDGPDALTPVVIYSSNESVLPLANVFFGGSGSDRTVYVVGGASVGTAEIVVSVADFNGNVAERFFRVSVEASNLAPVVSVSPTNTLLNTPVLVPFTVEDDATAATELAVTAVIEDYSTNLLASLSLTSEPNGTNRSVTVTPATGASGVGVVTLNVVDSGSKTTAVSFAVMVLPTGDTVFCDRFDYPLNEKILDFSGGLWDRRNSSAQNVVFRMSSLSQEAWIRPKSGADGLSARLIGAPYTPDSGAVLFTKFKATWTDLGDIIGDSIGPFLLLAPNGTATADTLGMVGTVTTGVPFGAHRVSVSNGGNTFSPLTSTDLLLETPYNIVMRYQVGSAEATLWVNATSESDPGVTATDVQDLGNGSYVHLRQQVDMGNIYLDDLTVVVVFPPTLNSITPSSGGSLDVFFNGGAGTTISDFAVEGSSTVNGAYNPVSAFLTDLGGGEFKATVTGVSGPENFYRVKRNPVQF